MLSFDRGCRGLVLSQLDLPDFVDPQWEALLTLSEQRMDTGSEEGWWKEEWWAFKLWLVCKMKKKLFNKK